MYANKFTGMQYIYIPNTDIMKSQFDQGTYMIYPPPQTITVDNFTDVIFRLKGLPADTAD